MEGFQVLVLWAQCGIYYLESSVTSSNPMELRWTWLDGSFQQNQHKVPLTQICLLWVFVEASNFTLQIIIPSCFAWMLAKNTQLAQPAAVRGFLESKSCRGIKNGEKVQAPPLLWPWWSLGWWDTAQVGRVLIHVFVPRGLCQRELCWPEQIEGFWSQLELKSHLLPGLRQPWRQLGLPSQGSASHEESFPTVFLDFTWLLLPDHVHSSHPNCCRLCPRCKKRAHVISKLQNHLPSVLQPSNLNHLLNHFYEWGEKI